MTTRRSLTRKRRKLAAAASAAALATVGFAGLGPVGPVESVGASNEARPKLADPDQYYGSDGYWYTYATTLKGVNGCGVGPVWNTFHVPVIKASGSSLNNECIDGDAMPSGPGSWAEGDIWAPSIAYFNGTYFLHYTATKAGTASAQYPNGHKCIGRATSSSPMGPFTNQQEFACPPAGRWAIDPDVYVGSEGVFLTYRDDAIATSASTGPNWLNESGMSAVQLNSSGHAIWSTRRDLLLSTDVGWEAAGSKNLVENPSYFKHDGRFYLVFSGNAWRSKNYAVGIADCGTSALPASRCKPLISAAQPYYAYSGSVHSPARLLPGNHPGPGAMSVTSTYKGTSTNVTWHWFEGLGPESDTRRIKSGVITNSSGYFNVS